MICRSVFILFSLTLAAAEPRVVTFNDDGAWSWFEDERAIIHDGRLFIGSVASGARDPERRGDIDVVTHDLTRGESTRFVLHDGLQLDDHNSPALLPRSDGRILAVWSRHGNDANIHYRITERPGDGSSWSERRTFAPSPSSRVTYANLHRLPAEGSGRGRFYNFFRGLDNSFKPSFAWSEDDGLTWDTGGIVIDVPSEFRHRPYVKYASNGRDTIHLLYTEGHPRNYDNSAYHVFYRRGNLHRSDGSVIRSIEEGLIRSEEGTRVFAGDADNVAWVSDLHLDAEGRPFTAYTVQKDSAGLPVGEGGEDHRYRQARWDGEKWRDREIAFGGSRLYPREDDYTGNIALDPADPDVVFISADVHPATGEPLISARDGKRHYEIFKGRSRDDGRTWEWTPMTRDSEADNIRPIIPIANEGPRVVLWLRGRYTTYTDYDLAVVGIVE
jgi:hypothetical protein